MSQDININSSQSENSYTNKAANFANSQQLRNSNVNSDNTKKDGISDDNITDVEETKNALVKSSETSMSEAISDEEINEAVEVVSAFMNNSFKHVGFSSDNSSGKTIIKVVDKETQELISQFPSEKMLAIAAKINGLHLEIEDASGLLVDNHV